MPILRVVEARSLSSSVSVFSRTRLFTRLISCRSLTGLVRKSSAPASRPLMRSETWSSAVIMTTGMCEVDGSAFSRRQTSKPSMPGIITSSSTTSTLPFSQVSIASAPLGGRQHLEIFGEQPDFQQLHIGRNVVDDKDAGGHCFLLLRNVARIMRRRDRI